MEEDSNVEDDLYRISRAEDVYVENSLTNIEDYNIVVV
jgi:hypothetical protein